MLLAQIAFDYAVALIGVQSLWAAWYSDHVPGLFLKLLGGEAAQRDALVLLKGIWRKLNHDEQLARENRLMSSVLFDMQWPAFPLVREWLVGLAEQKFERVPGWIADAIDHMSCQLATSKVVEDMFKTFSDTSRSSPNGQLSRKTRWVECLEGEVLADYGRPSIAATTSKLDNKQQRHLPKKIFESQQCEFSMGADKLKALSQAATWPTPCPQAMQNLPALTSWWLRTSGDASGDFAKSYMNLLCYRGTVIREKDVPLPKSWLVLYVCEWGLRCIQVAKHRDYGQVHFRVVPDRNFEFMCMLDPEKWAAIEVEPRSPAVFRMKLEPPREVIRGFGVVLCKVKRSTTVLKLAATRCFDSLTVPMLQKLQKKYLPNARFVIRGPGHRAPEVYKTNIMPRRRPQALVPWRWHVRTRLRHRS